MRSSAIRWRPNAAEESAVDPSSSSSAASSGASASSGRRLEARQLPLSSRKNSHYAETTT